MATREERRRRGSGWIGNLEAREERIGGVYGTRQLFALSSCTFCNSDQIIFSQTWLQERVLCASVSWSVGAREEEYHRQLMLLLLRGLHVCNFAVVVVIGRRCSSF